MLPPTGAASSRSSADSLSLAGPSIPLAKSFDFNKATEFRVTVIAPKLGEVNGVIGEVNGVIGEVNDAKAPRTPTDDKAGVCSY